MDKPKVLAELTEAILSYPVIAKRSWPSGQRTASDVAESIAKAHSCAFNSGAMPVLLDAICKRAYSPESCHFNVMASIALTVEKLSQSDMASARHLVWIMGQFSDRHSWISILSIMVPSSQSSLLWDDYELGLEVWREYNAVWDNVKLAGPFGLEFLWHSFRHGHVANHTKLLKQTFHYFSLSIVEKIFSANVSCSGEQGAQLVQDIGFIQDDVIRLAILIAYRAEMVSGEITADIFRHEDVITKDSSPIGRLLVYSSQLKVLGLSINRLVSTCQANPGWVPFQDDMASRVEKHSKLFVEEVYKAIGFGSWNLARIIWNML